MANLPVDELPSEFDVIVEGTGIHVMIGNVMFLSVGCVQCIVAGALSRVGKRVLHLDRYVFDYCSMCWLCSYRHAQTRTCINVLLIKYS